MMQGTSQINVRVIKETRSRVTIFIPTVNREMHVPKKEFFDRVESGVYNILNEEILEEDE